MTNLLVSFPAALVAKATVLLLLGFGITSLFRHAGADVRHRFWVVTFGGALALPLLMVALPGWEVLPPPSRTPTADAREASAAPGGAPRPAPGRTLRSGAASSPEAVSSPEAAPPSTVAASSGPPGMSAPGRLLSGSRGWLLGLWVSGTAAVLLWGACGLAGLAAIRRRAHRVTEPRILEELGSLARTAGVADRPVLLVASDALRVPATWGLLRPVILLPTAVVQGPSRERRTVVLHELLHIRRGVWPVQLMALAGCALYWFHPLAWLARGRLRAEEEFAVDEGMVGLGMRSTDYSEQLVRVVHLLRGELRPIRGSVPFLRRSSLEVRLRRLVRRPEPPSRLPVPFRLGAGAVLLLAVLAVAASDVRSQALRGQVDLVPAGTLEGPGLPGEDSFRRVVDAALLPEGRVAVLERWRERLLVLDADGGLIASSRVEPGPADVLLPYGEDGVAMGHRHEGHLDLHRVGPEGLEPVRVLDLPVGFEDACWMEGRFYLVDRPNASDRQAGRALRSVVRIVDEEGRLVGSLAPLPAEVEGVGEVPHRHALVACMPEHSLVIVKPVFFPEVSAWSPEGELRWRAELPGFRALEITGDRDRVTYAVREGEDAWHRVAAMVPAGADHLVIQLDLRSARPESGLDRVLGTSTFPLDVRSGEIGAPLGADLPRLLAGSRTRALGLTQVEMPPGATLHLYDVISP